MTKTAFFLTATLFLALGILLLQEARFLIPYRALLLYKYGAHILTFAAALFVNVFAVVHYFCRKLSLQDTGRKLLHLDRELRSGDSIAQELSNYLRD